MPDGYIKLHKCIRSNWLWTEDEPFDKRSAWIDLLLLATWRDTKRLVGGKLVEFKSGTVHKSLTDLADRWGWHRTTVSRFLKLLQSDGMVTVDATTHGTTITIVNWVFYQCDASTDARPTHDQCTTDARQMHTKEEIEEGNNNITISSNSSSSSYSSLRSEYSEDSELSDIVRQTKNVRPSQRHSEDITKVVDAWNELEAFGIRPISRISTDSKRYKSLVARLGQYSVDDILKAIEEVKHSKFLQGVNGKSWTIDFDWFVKPSNFPKVLEGNYRDKSPTGKKDWSFLEAK